MRALVATILVAMIVTACGTSIASPSPSPSAADPAIAIATPTPRPTLTPSPTATPTPTATPAPSPSPTPFAAATTTADAQATKPAPTAKITSTKKTRFFKVYGNSPLKLIDSTVAHSEPVCGTADTLACVRQSRNIEWMTSTDTATSACRITSVTVKLKSTVWLPRWVKSSSAPDGLTPWWSAMVKHFTWHEGQHISIEKRYEKKLGTLLVGKSCSRARKIIKKWSKSVDKAQAKFDARDASWPYPAYGP